MIKSQSPDASTFKEHILRSWESWALSREQVPWLLPWLLERSGTFDSSKRTPSGTPMSLPSHASHLSHPRSLSCCTQESLLSVWASRKFKEGTKPSTRFLSLSTSQYQGNHPNGWCLSDRNTCWRCKDFSCDALTKDFLTGLSCKLIYSIYI